MERVITIQQLQGLEPIKNNIEDFWLNQQLKNEVDVLLANGRITQDMATEEKKDIDNEKGLAYNDAVEYLRWAINVSASASKMTEEFKGECFAKGIGNIRTNFGIRVSTEFLKNLCDMDNKNQHITYMMRLAGLVTLPTYNYPMRRVFDLVYSPKELDLIEKTERQEKVRADCVIEWLNQKPQDTDKILAYEEQRELVDIGPESL